MERRLRQCLHRPGDSAGAIGRTYTVFKTNDAFTFAPRGAGTVTTLPDATFWNKLGGNFGGTSILDQGDGRVLIRSLRSMRRWTGTLASSGTGQSEFQRWNR